MKLVVIHIFFWFVLTPVLAQVNTYYFNETLATSQWNYNPALQSKEKIYIHLPVISGIHLDAGNSPFSYNDVIEDNQVKFTNIINHLEDQNHLLEGFHTNLLGLGYKIGSYQFRIGACAHFQSRMTYTKDLIELIWKGNGHPDLIGTRLSMDGTAANSMAWLSYYAGASGKFLDDKLNIGINLKLLNGIATTYTEQSAFGIYTNKDNYHITVDGSFNQHISGINVLTDDLSAKTFSPFNAEGNRGIGIDLGASWSMNDYLTLQGSVINLGRIKWIHDVENYHLSQQEVTYSGIELNEFFSSSNSTSSTLEQFVDSITDLFDPEENFNDFSTPMNTSYFVRGILDLSPHQHVSVFLADQNNFGKHFFSGGALYSKNIGNWFVLNGGIQAFRMKDFMVPLGFLIHFGPVQLGIHTENVLTIISPLNARYASGNFSLALRFGKEKRQKETPTEELD